VHFKPWGLAPFLPMPAAELCDRPVTVEQVWGRPAIAELRDRLGTADGPHEMLMLLEEELMRRLCETAGLGLVRHTSSVIAATSGAVAIGDLRVAAGVSSTHLAQRFKELIGVTPKRLAAPTASPPPCSRSTPPDRSTSPVAQATSTRPASATSSGRSPGSRRPGTSKSGGGSCANIPATCWTAGRCPPIDFLQERQLTTR
jgi:AraC-like DNA-binding protein